MTASASAIQFRAASPAVSARLPRSELATEAAKINVPARQNSHGGEHLPHESAQRRVGYREFQPILTPAEVTFGGRPHVALEHPVRAGVLEGPAQLGGHRHECVPERVRVHMEARLVPEAIHHRLDPASLVGLG